MTFRTLLYIITLAAIEYGRLAQLVEPPLDVRAVEGSSPPASTKKKKEVTFVYQKLLLFLILYPLFDRVFVFGIFGLGFCVIIGVLSFGDAQQTHKQNSQNRSADNIRHQQFVT